MTTMEVAADFVARGYAPIPIPFKEKRPLIEGWQNLRITDDASLARYFSHECNVGVLLGEPSGGLVDVDLDHLDAVRLANQYLPATGAVFGRASKAGSHRLYRVTGASALIGTKRWATHARVCICEVRGFGGQTVFPGSIHPSGEEIRWDQDGEPAEVEWDVLRAACDALFEHITGESPTSTVALQAVHRAGQPDDSPEVVKRAEKYLAGIPGAISGQNGHGQTFAAATCLVHGFGLSPDTALNMLLALYNHRCDPPWNERELMHKVNQAAGTMHAKPYGWLRDAKMERGPEGDRLYGSGDPYSVNDISKENPPATGQVAGGGLGEDQPAKAGPASERESNSTPRKAWVPRSARKLIEDHPALRPEVIYGLLRQGETLNIMAAPGTGKSVLVNNLAIAVATGGKWMGEFPVRQGKILILDNELHDETAAFRLRTTASKMGLGIDDYGDAVHVECFRGRQPRLSGLTKLVADIAENEYAIIVIDAAYRIYDDGTDENSNSDIESMFNKLDAMAKGTRSAFVLVHHTSKGNQSEKEGIDVGAGAGAWNRAADSVMILRPHEKDNHVVAGFPKLRNFAPRNPQVFRFNFPLYEPDDTHLDPLDLRPPPKKKAKKVEDDGWSEQEARWTPERLAREIVTGPMSDAAIQEALEALPVVPKEVKSSRGLSKLLRLAVEKGVLVQSGRGALLRYSRP